MPDFDQLILLGVVALAASVLQSAAGIGFGVIAGPIMLLALDSSAGIQLSILLSLLIAIAMLPSLWRRVDWPMLRAFLIGSVLGVPFGFAVFLAVPIKVLKLFAGLGVLLAFVLMWFGSRPGGLQGREPGKSARDLVAGVASGVMSGSLAMPGPVPAARMTAVGRSADEVRGTMMALFVVSYGAALVLQASLASIERETLGLTLILAVPTLAGVVIGRTLASRFSGTMFNRLIAFVLVATGLTLVVDGLR